MESNSRKEDIMLEIEELQLVIAVKTQQANALYTERRDLSKEVEGLQNELKLIEEGEAENRVHKYMLTNFGIKNRHDGNSCFLIFNKFGQYVETLRRGIDYNVNDDLEFKLRERNQYGHSASSWYARCAGFYESDFPTQLRCLSWEFGMLGELIETDW